MAAHPAERTWFTTIVGILTILTGAASSLFSAFALLLALGKPYANASTTALDILLLFVLPPLTLFAGVCLLLRHRWARWWMILLSAGLVIVGLREILAPAPVEEPFSPVAPVVPIVFTALGALLLIGLFAPGVRREFQTAAKTTPPPIPQPSAPQFAEPPPAKRPPSLVRQLAVSSVAAAVCLWVAWDTFDTGEIRKNGRFSAERRVATREENPIYYWTMLSLLTLVGTGCAAHSIHLLATSLLRQPSR